MQDKVLIISILQTLIALGIVNVWIVRFKKSTKYRGAGAVDMKSEFAAYGLPSWSVYVIGCAKIVLATFLIIGLWILPFTPLAAFFMAILMSGAIAMHIKVRDPLIRTLPAVTMLSMCVAILLLVYVF